MENNIAVLWSKTDTPVLPKKVNNISELVSLGMQLSSKDQSQIIRTFEDGSYEMVSTYIWTKSINSLRNQLSKMGMSFIAEMLDRPDINEHTNLQQAISEFEAIKLAEELGVISPTSAFRLKQAMQTVTHFNQPELEDDPENELTEEEAKIIVRSCIQGILGYNRIEAAIDFKNFRTDLEEKTLTEDSVYIYKLIQSPYFFHRTTIRILLSLVKSASGAQLENSLANSNLIIPKIWEGLKHPERYQIGRSYSELFADGKNRAASGLKQVLLKVKGFDFVPEDLRSSSFIKAANEVLIAHEGMNNFYNEPAPLRTLYNMGSVIPIPAFPVCITAILSVRLGNWYGVSRAAQDTATEMLKNITQERWVFFFNELLETDDRILYKLTQDSPSSRWMKLFSDKFIDSILTQIQHRDIINLLKFTKEKKQSRVNKIASEMYVKLGYGDK
ncbi:hypothetical protein AM493_15170 [Flavobacterium akiainvivens]|uniref:Uncharacterized protein n=1 Tax=Flavobacterium akiainvivens TaxID=1202724 RepID=A0A0M8MJR3_9FLAO|nr:hypothetical protein [Flavobacterium akiainvivens]KOS07227.1 hypothetical protein AM493_15170 [Flavobacterium akiainvivens]SFQ45300.1 hypothetical protein SAMN05444144_10516 [Flavobacterium akiainvivens]